MLNLEDEKLKGKKVFNSFNQYIYSVKYLSGLKQC